MLPSSSPLPAKCWFVFWQRIKTELKVILQKKKGMKPTLCLNLRCSLCIYMKNLLESWKYSLIFFELLFLQIVNKLYRQISLHLKISLSRALLLTHRAFSAHNQLIYCSCYSSLKEWAILVIQQMKFVGLSVGQPPLWDLPCGPGKHDVGEKIKNGACFQSLSWMGISLVNQINENFSIA